MEQSHIERRRSRRVILQAPLVIRRGPHQREPTKPLVTKDIGLAGLYFEAGTDERFTVNEVLTASLSVPEPHRREFPFTRVVGRGRVVRVHRLQDEAEPRVGVAIEFGDEVTALTAIPTRES